MIAPSLLGEQKRMIFFPSLSPPSLPSGLTHHFLRMLNSLRMLKDTIICCLLWSEYKFPHIRGKVQESFFSWHTFICVRCSGKLFGLESDYKSDRM